MTVTAEYIGSWTVHADSSTDVNVPSPGPGGIQARRPYPKLAPFTTIRWDGWATFNALTLKVTRRFASGLSFDADYTLSKSVDDASDTGTTNAEYNWSAQENASHLPDLKPLWLARLRDYALPSEQLTAANLGNRKTDKARHNTRRLEQILMGFRAARARLLKRVDGLDRSLFLEPAILHPRLKQPMRLIDHLYFVAEHDDHHLARIRELLP